MIPFSEGEPTPEFVRWTIGRPCPLREEFAWTDPEQTERLLRPVRAVGDARREGRICDGFAFALPAPAEGEIDQVLGFRVDEALAVFGGEQQVAANCGPCPANVASFEQATLAGCFGMFLLANAAAFHDAVERAVENLGLYEPLAREFTETRPRWYGFWLDEALTPNQAQLQHGVLSHVASLAPDAAPMLDAFVVGLRVSLEVGLPMYARLVPAGRRQQYAWKLDPHCKRCRAPRPLGQRRCRVCGVVGDVCAGRTRKIRGQRPYYPLIRQLDAARLTELVDRYNAR